MPLEALRYDVAPPGLHHVLTHHDIPAVDRGTWLLGITGVERGVEQGYARGLPPAEVMRPEVLLVRRWTVLRCRPSTALRCGCWRPAGTDGAGTWSAAELAPADAAHPSAWRAWSFPWTAEPGTWELLPRATDAAGGQPTSRSGTARAWRTTWCGGCR